MRDGKTYAFDNGTFTIDTGTCFFKNTTTGHSGHFDAFRTVKLNRDFLNELQRDRTIFPTLESYMDSLK